MSWAPLLLLLVILALVVIAAAGWWLWRAISDTPSAAPGTSSPDPELSEYLHQLEQLSLPEAAKQAERVLRHGKRFITHPAGAPDFDRRSMLGPTLQVFFHRYDEVIGRDEYVRRDEIAPCPDNPAYIRLGQDSQSVPLVARPGEDRVIVLSGEAPLDDDEPHETYPSIYHWLLHSARRYDLERQ